MLLGSLYYLDVYGCIDIKSLKNRLLKVCYVPTTGTSLPMLLFLLPPLTVLMKHARQAVHAVKQSLSFTNGVSEANVVK